MENPRYIQITSTSSDEGKTHANLQNDLTKIVGVAFS